MNRAPKTAAELATFASDVKRALLRQSFLDFVRWSWPLVTGEPFVANELTTRMIAGLQRVGDGELTRVLIAMPPGAGKSTMLVCYAAWRLARDPGHRSIHASHAFEGVAKRDSMRTRRLVEHDEYRRLFQGLAFRSDANTQGEWETTRGGIFIALGLDGGMTGKRAREAVIDDPLDANDRFSKSAHDKVWEWYSGSLLSRLDGDDAPIIVVHQRLGKFDLIGLLIAVGGWTLVELPSELEDGTLLAPNVLTRKKCDDLKAPGGMGSAAYTCQYLQRPSDDNDASIKRAWWRFHRPVHVPEETPRPSGCISAELAPAVETPMEFTRIVIAVDMTQGTTGVKNDYAVIQAWGAIGAGRYLLKQWRAKVTLLVQHEAIRQMRREYPGAPIVVEKAAGGHGAVELLTAQGFTGVIGVSTGNKSKALRLSLVTPSIEAGNCFLPLGANWLGDYVEELAGATAHDDASDTTAYALAHLAIYGALGDEPTHGGFSGSLTDASTSTPLPGRTAGYSPANDERSDGVTASYSIDPYR